MDKYLLWSTPPLRTDRIQQACAAAATVSGLVYLTTDHETALCTANDVKLNDVQKDISQIIGKDSSKARLLLRLACHSSGTCCKESKTGGSEGATIRFEPDASFAPNEGGPTFQSDNKALSNFSLTIRPGRSTGLVGTIKGEVS